MDELRLKPDCKNWLKDLKQRVRQTQVKAAVQVNTTLLMFYWELGADIVERQKSAKWGSGFLKQLTQAQPDNLKTSLHSIEELEAEFSVDEIEEPEK